jgi:UDPglucose 6-dehydrogenase
LRLGQALEAFRNPARVVVGIASDAQRARIAALLEWVSDRIEWMSIESAEMTKHALNGFLAASVTYINEVARVCEAVGADAAEVERGLRSEPRIGRRAYVSPGAPIGGGTLARDVTFLKELATQHGLSVPVLSGILESNRIHGSWAETRVRDLLREVPGPRVAMLGLTYKPGTDTLRRSTAVELAKRLAQAQMDVRAFDPSLRELPPELSWIALAPNLESALAGADAAVLATAWPEFATISAELIARTMRRPHIIDQVGFLAHLTEDARVHYVRVGRGRVPAMQAQ